MSPALVTRDVCGIWGHPWDGIQLILWHQLALVPVMLRASGALKWRWVPWAHHCPMGRLELAAWAPRAATAHLMQGILVFPSLADSKNPTKIFKQLL